jgi:hypothetical protein
MMQNYSPGDELVLERLSRSPNGVSAVMIGKASLGPRASRHSRESLNMIGLSIAARLVGQGLIEATRTNQFRMRPSQHP